MAEQIPLKVYKTSLPGRFDDPRLSVQYQVLPGYNTPYGYQETTLQDMLANAADSNKATILREIQNQISAPISRLEDIASSQSIYTTDPKTGALTTFKALDDAQRLANDPNMINIGTPNAPKYVPKGSAAAANVANYSTQNTANQVNNTPPLNPNQPTPASYPSGQVTGTLPNGMQTTFVDEATARQYGATNITPSSPSNAGGTQSAAPESTGAGGTGGIASTLPSTGNPQLDALLGHLDEFVQQNIANGNKINPNIELTPAEVQKFLDQATGEISPYYQNIIRSVKDDLTRNLTNMQQQYDLKKQADEAQFKQQLGSQREQAAGAGLTFSGQRNLGELNTAASQDRNLQSSALAAAKASQDAIRTTEQKIGSRNLSDLTSPTFNSYSSSLEGAGGFNTGRSLDFGPLGQVEGSLEYSQRGDIRQLSDFYKNAEIQKRSLNFSG